jgi:replicative DNA helicase
MSYNSGLKAIRRLCEQQQSIEWFRAKLTPALFKPNELPVFQWVDEHVRKHHNLPQIETLSQMFPEVMDAPTPEPASYYVQILENAYFYSQINYANVESTKVLKADQNAWEPAVNILRGTINRITLQNYRTKIMDFGAEAGPMLLQAYHNIHSLENVSEFGWPYMDKMGGVMPGDVASFIGRPQAGKSFLSLYTALHNWRVRQQSVLVVSMEMSHLPMAQRAAAMIAGTNLTQLKQGAYASKTYDKFASSMFSVAAPSDSPGPKLYIVNGNLAADVEDMYTLADQLKCASIIIDGAYLARHKNTRLDRFTRAAENCELMKRFSEDLQVGTFSSWQFNREASKKKAKGEPAGGTLDDIGYSDAIGQISSIVLGLFQEDGVETMNRKRIRVLKGRGGEVGEFEIEWNFLNMNFNQITIDGEEQPVDKLSEEFL